MDPNPPQSQNTGAEQGHVSEAQYELSRVLKDFKHDPAYVGVWSLGKDGVLRSLTAERDVVDAVGLPPRLVKAILDRQPFNPQNEVDYRGVDGTTVPREQWLHPDESLLPPPLVLTDEQRRSAEEKAEEIKALLEERVKEVRVPCVVSDHNLGL